MILREEVPGLAKTTSLAVKVDALSAAAAGISKAQPELAISYCPSCSTRLASRSCKLICSGCGYYMSCSDFY
jgi:hypothetical protein